MKLIGIPGTELRHILAAYIMCPSDLYCRPIFPKIGSRDPEVLLNVCAYFEILLAGSCPGSSYIFQVS